MNIKTAFLSLSLGLALVASPVQAADWSDTSIHYWVGNKFQEPANPNDITKNVFSFTHASGYKYGGNYFNADFLYSSKANGHFNAPTGAAEVYAVYRHSLSLSALSGSKMAFGPVRDVSLVLGIDGNTKNDSFGSKKIMPVGGAKLSFDVPGFLDLGVLAAKEWNVNGIVNKNVTFDVTAIVSAAWSINVYGPITFEGFGNVVLPKGTDGFGNDTKTEVLLHPKFMADVATFWGSKGIQAGVGFQYWLNKFGNDSSTTVGCEETAFFLEAAYHL